MYSLQSIENADCCRCSCSDKEDGKWDPAKDLVGGDLVLGEAGFVFSAHSVKVSDFVG